MKASIIKGLQDVCEEAFVREAAPYPDFLVESWFDQVHVARAVIAGDANPFDRGLSTVMAGIDVTTATPEDIEAGVGEWAMQVLTKNHNFVTARLKLAGMFKQASAAIMAAPDEELKPLLATIYPLAVASALEVGTTVSNDRHLEKRVHSWYMDALGMIDPLLDVGEGSDE